MSVSTGKLWHLRESKPVADSTDELSPLPPLAGDREDVFVIGLVIAAVHGADNSPTAGNRNARASSPLVRPAQSAFVGLRRDNA